MFKNYIKIAWRNLMKNKLFSLINILGLGLSLPFALLCLIQVQSAFEADNFHPYPDRTYRIITDVKDNGGNVTNYALSPQAVSEALQNNYPAIERATFTIRDYNWELNDKLKTISANPIYVEPSFFNMFGFKFISGNKPVEPNSIAITKEKAEAFFGASNAVGKVLSHPDYGDFVISGVLAPFKRNTVFKTDIMVSMSTWKKFHTSNPGATSLTGFTYILMQPNANDRQLAAALNSVATKINGEPAAKSKKESFTFRKQGIEQIAPAFEDLEGNSYVDSISDLSVNFSFAIGLLILATFNYINLTLARSVSRAKEVGLRKTVGARQYQLITQFICEALLTTSLSLGVGFIVLQLLKKFSYVNWFAWDVDNQWILWSCFILFTIILGVLAGLIPAKILSRFKPVNVLKGAIAPAAMGKTFLRNILVVIQFVASACFIFIVASMFGQFRYMATDNTNFNRENIYNIAVSENQHLLQRDILANKNVERVGMVSTPFGGNAAQASVAKNAQSDSVAANYYAADSDFISNMNISIVAGSNLTASVSDSASDFVLVNEQLLSAIGLGKAKEAIGKTFMLNNRREVIIGGVTSDFCYSNYQFSAQPLIIQYNPQQFHVLNIKTKNKVDDRQFKSEMNIIWKKYFPHTEISFSNYQKDLYERYFPGGDMNIIGTFCVVVLTIALMGLLGIVTYHNELRTKEVGIRKVMGASVKEIIRELSKSFVKLTLISGLISLPLGYAICFLFMKLFAYSYGVDLLLLCILFTFIFGIALITIIYKSARAATANPVNSLRTE